MSSVDFQDRSDCRAILLQTIAAFPSTYFHAHFRISHKKMLDGNGKMRINSTFLNSTFYHSSIYQINLSIRIKKVT